MNLLIYNAKILTQDPDNPRAEAALVLDEYFAYVGSEEGARSFARKGAHSFEELDAQGKTLLPSFNDSHLHFLHYVRAKSSVDLFSATSLKEVLQRMEEAAKSRDPHHPLWLSGEGWNQDYFTDEKRFPTRADLDQISTEIPILMMRACFHIGVLNSKALEILGLTQERLRQEDLEKYPGLLDLDEKGNPTGIVREFLFDDIKAKMPAPELDFLVKELLESQKDLFKQGITSIQSDDVKYVPGEAYVDFYQKLGEASENGELQLRYGLQVLVDHLPSLEKMLSTGITSFHRGRVKFNCVKILTDGSLGARTALLSQDYEDEPGQRGISIFSDQELQAMVARCQEKNLPVALHAIGNGAIKQSLEAISIAKKRYPYLHPRHGIVHAQITDNTLLETMKELDVTVFAQPIFISYDMHMVKDRVGAQLASTSYAWKSMVDLGIPCSFGTDAPVEPFSTLPNLYTAFLRKDLQGRGPYRQDQALSLEKALQCYSYQSAYVEGEEDHKGIIRPGFFADFILTNEDFLEREENLLDAKIYQTYLAGQCVYSLE